MPIVALNLRFNSRTVAQFEEQAFWRHSVQVSEFLSFSANCESLLLTSMPERIIDLVFEKRAG
jgi:hypothetical protein